VTYSLNIANARDGWSTVQTQQSLLIYDQQSSTVSVGKSLTYAANGTLSSTSFIKDAGLSLQIKPAFRDDGVVNLQVSATLENFLPSSAGSFNESVLTEKSTTGVTADLRFGETILIASGDSATNSRSGSKTPILADLPVLGKLFSSRSDTKLNTSLLILLTLRPRGSERLQDAGQVEREMFRIRKDKLLEQLGSNSESRFYRFIPDQSLMSYKIENPARRGDLSYLLRTGVF
jgi:type II secretory pathway component GspD/PulD (secretin)